MEKRAAFRFIILVILAQFLTGFQNLPAFENLSELYLVILKEPSMVEKVLEWAPQETGHVRRLILESPEAETYRAFLEDYQIRFSRQMRGEGLGVPLLGQGYLEVVDRGSFLLNRMLIRGSPEKIAQLERSEKVLGIYPMVQRFPLLDAAPQLIGAPSFWAALGEVENAGRGIKIGIIDSGIDQEHPMFNDNNLSAPTGFPLGDPDYTNSKVIVARTYVSSEYGLREQTNKTPEDETGHDSRVAAVAAGKSINAPLGHIQGIAPKAFLGNYKVFGTPGINSFYQHCDHSRGRGRGPRWDGCHQSQFGRASPRSEERPRADSHCSSDRTRYCGCHRRRKLRPGPVYAHLPRNQSGSDHRRSH